MIRFFASHPTASNLMMAVLILGGLLTSPYLQRETLPGIEPRKVSVSVPFPGARPEEVEEAICRRIEDAVESVENIAKISCEAKENLASATIEMKEGENLDRFIAKVKNQVEAIDDFPEETDLPVVEEMGTTEFVASIALTGFQNKSHLKAYALAVKDRMLLWGGISQIDIKGFSDHQIRIELSKTALQQFGLSIASIADTIAKQSLDLPGGIIETSEELVSLRFADERKQAHEFLDLVLVSSQDGGIVRLRDIATVTDRFSLDEEKIMFDGEPAALLEISKTKSEDILDVVSSVKEFLQAEQALAPPNVKLTLSNDNSSIVQDRLNLLIENGLQGLALVFLIMWLFFGFRYSFWVTMGLPVSFLGALAIMYLMGLSLNMMSMLGLLIATGLLMDDAIVISENIASQKEKGKSSLDAAIDGAAQVFPSIFASFLTTAMVLGSLIFLNGDTGQVLRVVPIVMLFVLSISLAEAFLILPHHLLHTLEQDMGKSARFRKVVESKLDYIRENVVGRFVDFCVHWRYVTVGVAFALLIVAISMFAGGILKFSVFPDLDGDVIEARILLPQGTPLSKTEDAVQDVKDALVRLNARLSPDQPDEQPLVQHITVQYNKNTDAYETGSHIATVTADLLSAEMRTTSSDNFVSFWREEIGQLADVLSLKITETVVGPGGQAIEVRLQGLDLKQLKLASQELQGWLSSYEGTTNLTDDLRPGKKEIKLRATEQAATLGLSAQDIASQLRTSFFGSTISEIQVGAEAFEVDVRVGLEDRDSLADLDNFMITTMDGGLVPLKAVASLVEGRGYARINRYQRAQVVTVQGDVDQQYANANAILSDTKLRFFPELQSRFPGLKIQLGGQDEEGAKTQKSMMLGFLIGMIGVFVMLSFQFRSYVEPVVVMVIIPLSFIGVIFGHIAMGLDFTMPSILGFIAMAGVVVNNSILLVNFVKDHHDEYECVAVAAPLAARSRFRAIFITTLTTIAGMLPLLTETSLQAQILIPMVASLAFGLMASVIMVLFVVPSIYAILDDFGLSTLARKRSEDPSIFAQR